MNWTLYFALGSAVLALIYGAVSITQVMKLPRGNDVMQSISDAIQQGASAYLRRQYTTIAIVGVILLIIIAVFRSGQSGAGNHRFFDRRRLIRARGFYRYERLRPHECAHC